MSASETNTLQGAFMRDVAGEKDRIVAPPAHGLVLVDRPKPGIALLTMNRPEARNSLSLAMLDALEEALGGVSAERGLAAVVLAANGPVFSAGHDLKELTAHRSDADGGRAFFADTMERCARFMLSIVASPKPVIAAAETAKLATPGVNIGLFCSTPMVALSRNVPRKRAMEMLLLGEMLSAQEAADYGLINRVVPPGKALDEALAMAGRIAVKPKATVAIGKAAFYKQVEQPLAEAYAFAARVMVENMMARDAEEGIGAFIEKREPDW